MSATESHARYPPPDTPPVAAPPVVAPVPPAPAPVPPRTHVKIDSQPDGAEVRRGGDLLGRTPLELELPADTPAFEVVVSRHGFHEATLQIAPDRSRAGNGLAVRRADLAPYQVLAEDGP